MPPLRRVDGYLLVWKATGFLPIAPHEGLLNLRSGEGAFGEWGPRLSPPYPILESLEEQNPGEGSSE
jgi:hypothetical protein